MNILIVRVSSMGDVVHNMPMVADILRHHPDANIDWVVEEGYTSLVRLNLGVRRVIPFALRRWRKSLWSPATRAEMRAFYASLQEDAYDYVFDTQGLFKTGLVMRLARLAPGGKRIGLGNATAGSGYEAISRIFHSVSVPVGLHAHAVTRARLLGVAAFGYPIDSAVDFAMQPPAERYSWLPEIPYAVFFHGTARASKQWRSADWVQVALMLADYGLPVLLPWGSQQELQQAQALAAQMPNARVLPKLSMMEAVTLAQRAALVVGVDTGLTHIAAAYSRPTIELYCDSPRWKTQGDWSDKIINLGDVGNRPDLVEVKAAVTRLLGQNGA
ncbi:lipopolysaccharide heptosyltransferase I [Undibacterium arcticum]|uniref:Lipopolysaccharide heptosyltransferase 1 n=1 Tax=Undibacterium arcticum TaxID=1762892 RepID=A0ABV7F9B7_9BURK